MSAPSLPSARRVHPCAFTLVELLVVLTVIAILAALIIPSIGPLLISYNLNRASSMITDELTFARQAALTHNADVEVRFYQTDSSVGNLQFQAFRSWLAATAATTAQPLDKISYLPGQTIIFSAPDPSTSNPSTTFSPLLDSATHSVLSTGQDALPGSTSPSTYVSFRFRATGGTNLSPVTTLWYLTVCSKSAPINATTHLPSNYVTVQIDPVTAIERTYRP